MNKAQIAVRKGILYRKCRGYADLRPAAVIRACVIAKSLDGLDASVLAHEQLDKVGEILVDEVLNNADALGNARTDVTCHVEPAAMSLCPSAYRALLHRNDTASLGLIGRGHSLRPQ